MNDCIQNRTWAEVDLDNVRHNFQVIQSRVAPGTKILAVIKADAYGHGAVPLAKLYTRLGVDYFAVAALDEAIQLRNADITTPILILGHTPSQSCADLIHYNITQTVYDLADAQELSQQAVAMNGRVKVHIKVDTGMSRIGVMYQDEQRDSDAVELIQQIHALPGLECEGIFTHFAVADETGNPFTFTQFQLFTGLIGLLKERGITFPLCHCSNSGAILNYPPMHLDMVRAGLILYGVFPMEEKSNFDLRPAMSLKTVISNVKTIEKGATVSYGRRFTAPRRMRVATIPVGYADGISRVLSGKISVIVGGTLAPLIGNICMDQCMVDVSGIPQVEIGDVVTLFGGPEDSFGLLGRIADAWGTINYEVLCQVSKRIPRVYLENGQPVSSLTYIV
ncbi:MAG: alanine racemase [Eubacteriales bacterium]|jgi:alanine racemase